MKKTVKDARGKQRTAVANKPVNVYFTPASCGPSSWGADSVATQFDCSSVPTKTLQAVAFVLFACATNTPFRHVASPIIQGLVEILRGRAQFSSPEVIDSHLHVVFGSVFHFLRTACESTLVGNVTLDGWSAALGAPFLGITWNLFDDGWRLK